MDVLTAMSIQTSYINVLLGEQATTQRHVRNHLVSDAIPYSSDSLVSLALQKRNEVRIAEKRVLLSQVYMDLIKTGEKPVISAFASGGWKNGYIPELDMPKANFAVGLSLLIPIYDATRTNLHTSLAGSSVRNNIFELDLAKRNITNEIMENINALKSAISKTELFKMQLSQAKKAMELAELRFKSGTLTNLDLLDAENAVSESCLLYLKARIDRVMIDYKLKAALGINLYSEN
jgi:outer membrane protein TolC